jgi:hypothetical protein
LNSPLIKSIKPFQSSIRSLNVFSFAILLLYSTFFLIKPLFVQIGLLNFAILYMLVLKPLICAFLIKFSICFSIFLQQDLKLSILPAVLNSCACLIDLKYYFFLFFFKKDIFYMKNEKIWGNPKLDYENYMTSPFCRFVNSSYGRFSSYILR